MEAFALLFPFRQLFNFKSESSMVLGPLVALVRQAAFAVAKVVLVRLNG